MILEVMVGFEGVGNETKVRVSGRGTRVSGHGNW